MPVIRDKHDVESARKLVALGYPVVAPALSDMMEWIQDMNWPVAKVLAPFLAALGEAVVPEVRRVLASDDHLWKYWCINDIIGEMPVKAARQFTADLHRYALTPTEAERKEELDEVAKAALSRIDEQSGA
ncbi:MAG: DUF5071 domain-containing protein [Candidatus Latescibacterota bacterium]|nr:MAG: DUF5071 domain-containing protein [Candidatus Latescibacterota bacterium]